MRAFHLLAGTTIALALAANAEAAQKPIQNKKDPRLWEFTYGPDEIYQAHGAPGAVLLIQLAADEQILKVKTGDSETIHEGHSDNLVTLKFNGCALPEPVVVISHKANPDELRPYVFEIKTIPEICSRMIPGQPPQQQGDPALSNAAYSAGSLDPQPNLKHLAHPNDLAEGGPIPFKIKMRYPGDDRAKQEAAAATFAKKREKLQVARVLKEAANGQRATTGFVNDHYRGRGDRELRPAYGPIDDGNTTKIYYPGGVAVPALSKLGNPAQGCGDKGEESAADYAVHATPDGKGQVMLINGTAAGWCLRLSRRVYEASNASFNPVGYPTGTKTITPQVELVVKGSPDGR